MSINTIMKNQDILDQLTAYILGKIPAPAVGYHAKALTNPNYDVFPLTTSYQLLTSLSFVPDVSGTVQISCNFAIRATTASNYDVSAVVYVNGTPFQYSQQSTTGNNHTDNFDIFCVYPVVAGVNYIIQRGLKTNVDSYGTVNTYQSQLTVIYNLK